GWVGNFLFFKKLRFLGKHLKSARGVSMQPAVDLSRQVDGRCLVSIFSLPAASLNPVIPTKVGIQDSGPEKPFYPISFRADRPRFPLSRE
ncbi:hypothetical protein, partial [Neisseria gonorrhoeae]